jgi:hypothetical protein
MIIAFHDLWKTALLITIGKRWDFVLGRLWSISNWIADISRLGKSFPLRPLSCQALTVASIPKAEIALNGEPRTLALIRKIGWEGDRSSSSVCAALYR